MMGKLKPENQGIPGHAFLQYLNDEYRPKRQARALLRAKRGGKVIEGEILILSRELAHIIDGKNAVTEAILQGLAADVGYRVGTSEYQDFMARGQDYMRDCAAKPAEVKSETQPTSQPKGPGQKATNPVILVLQDICKTRVISGGIERKIALENDPITKQGHWNTLTVAKLREQCGYQSEIISLNKAFTRGTAEHNLKTVLHAMLVQENSSDWQRAFAALDTLDLKEKAPKTPIHHKRQPVTGVYR